MLLKYFFCVIEGNVELHAQSSFAGPAWLKEEVFYQIGKSQKGTVNVQAGKQTVEFTNCLNVIPYKK